MSSAVRVKIMVAIGTRPEAIKLAPVVHELARHEPDVSSFVCATGQHRELLGRTLEVLNLRTDLNLDVMEHDQQLATLTGRLLERLDRVICDHRPDWILVQGDTTTAMAGALAGFYRRVRVGHVEAGLRTADLHQPFPEELNRRIVDLCADACFAPTESARANLLGEGVPADRVYVTGNTIVDAVLAVAERPYDVRSGPLARVPRDRRWVLVTAHRRESFGAPLQRIAGAVARLALAFETSIHVIVPVHPNPNVRATMSALLALANCSVVPPLDYGDLVHVLSRASLVLTDSGGLQEEAPSFGVPVLVLRDKSERPEGLDAGVARLVGTDADVIVSEASKILEGDRVPAPIENPYGDGAAARRVVAILRRCSGLPPLPNCHPIEAEEWRGSAARVDRAGSKCAT
jgi:UDP-N-acetylglucosamine 2-epimerase (non-hydrolysing)